jgi:hypothetical protein
VNEQFTQSLQTLTQQGPMTLLESASQRDTEVGSSGHNTFILNLFDKFIETHFEKAPEEMMTVFGRASSINGWPLSAYVESIHRRIAEARAKLNACISSGRADDATSFREAFSAITEPLTSALNELETAASNLAGGFSSQGTRADPNVEDNILKVVAADVYRVRREVRHTKTPSVHPVSR